MRRLTLLSGPVRPLSTRAHRRLSEEPSYLPIEVLDPASALAARRYPRLLRSARDDLVAVADTGAVWTGPAAWTIVLWALRRTRAEALRMTTPKRRLRARARLLALAGDDAAQGPSLDGPDVASLTVWGMTVLASGVAWGATPAAVVLAVPAIFLSAGGLRGLTRATLWLGAWVLLVLGSWALSPSLGYGMALVSPLTFLLLIGVAAGAAPTPSVRREVRRGGAVPRAGSGPSTSPRRS